MTSSALTISELVDVAFGFPEPGALNFNVLQLVVRSVVQSLALGDIETEFDRKTIDNLQHRVSEPPIYTTINQFRDHFSQVEMIEEDGFVSGLLPPRRKSVQLTDESGMLINRGRRGSTGMIRADERSRPTVFKKPLPPIMSFRELELKVSRLEENWAKLHQLKAMRQKIQSRSLQEHEDEKDGKEWKEWKEGMEGKEVDQDDIDLIRPPPMTVQEMWQSVQFEKKLETNTEGVNKLMSLTQDIIRKLQKMNEPVLAEHDHVTDKRHDTQGLSAASQSKFDDIQAQLNYLSEIVQQFPEPGTLNNFITWAALDSSLRGDDPIHNLLDPDHDPAHLDGRADLHDPTKGRTSDGRSAQLHKLKGKKHGEVVTSPDQETKKRKSSQGRTVPQLQAKETKHPETRKIDTQLEAKETKHLDTKKIDTPPETKRRKSLESKADQAQIVKKGVLKEVLRQVTASSSGLLGGEAKSIGSEVDLESSSDGGEGEIVRVDSMDHGQPMLALSPDFLTRLHALGKVNERFERLESKLEELEHQNLSEKGSDEMKQSSNVALNTITKQIEAVNKELRSYKETKNELNAMQEQLDSSQMPSMAYSQSILAASGSRPAMGVHEDGSPQDPTTTTAGETEDGGEDDDGTIHHLQLPMVKRSRSVAFDSIEKSMKVIDSTLAVLQRSVKDLDNKYKKQLESVNRRLDTVRVDAMEASQTSTPYTHTADDDDDEEEEEEEEMVMEGGIGSRVTFLERTMIEKQREMRKVQTQMTDLSVEVNTQMEGIMNNFNSFVQNVEHDLGMKALSAAAQDDTMNVVYGVQTTFSNVRDEVDKLKSFTTELYNTTNRQQNDLDILRLNSDDLRERSDLVERQLETTHNALEQKVDSDRFDEKCDDLSNTLSNVLNRMALLDKEWKKMVEKLNIDMQSLVGREEFDSLSVTMISGIHEVAKKLSRLQKQVDEMRFLSDDAAAVKRQLFSCLCCDRPVTMTTKAPMPSIPCREGLFSRRSTKPFTTYGLEQIRQNARGFVRPRNMSNYERALYERRLTQSSIRDLRSDCANYWRTKSRGSNLVGPHSDDRDHHHHHRINTTPRRVVSNTDPNALDARSNQHPSATSLGSHRPESEVSNHGPLSSGFQKVEGGGGENSSKIDTTTLPTESSSVKPNEAQQLQTLNPSEGKEDTSRRTSEPSTPPRNAILRRGTPANLGLGFPVRTSKGGRPNTSSISEDDDGSQPRRRSSGGPPPAAMLIKRRGTGFVQNLSLPGKTPPSSSSNRSSTGEAIAENDDSRRRSSGSSGKERSLPPNNSPVSSAHRRGTPAVTNPTVGLLPEKQRISGIATAFSIAEEEERIRRQSQESTASESPQDKRLSNPNTADIATIQNVIKEEVEVSASAAEPDRRDSDKNIGLEDLKEEDEGTAEDSSLKKPE